MYVRNISVSQVTWSCIYALILGSGHLHVMYVRNISVSQVTWSCIYTLLLESVCLRVMYVRHLLNSQVPHNGQCPFMCAVCKKSFSSQMPWRCIYTLMLEGDHLLVVFVGNLSNSLVPSRCTCTFIHCTGSLHVIYIRIRWWCPVRWRFEASNSWVCMTKFFYCMWSVTSLLGNSKLYILNPYSFRQCAKIIMLHGCDSHYVDVWWFMSIFSCSWLLPLCSVIGNSCSLCLHIYWLL